jgi:hypothetical protein
VAGEGSGDFGFWILNGGLKTMVNVGFWILDGGLKTMFNGGFIQNSKLLIQNFAACAECAFPRDHFFDRIGA